MSQRMFGVLLLGISLSCMHGVSTAITQTEQTLLIPCRSYDNYYSFTGDEVSYLRIYTDPYHRWKLFSDNVCQAWIHVPTRKFLSLRIMPFEPTSSCRDLGVFLMISRYRDDKVVLYMQPCDGHTTYHSNDSLALVKVLIGQVNPTFNITIVVRNLEQNARWYLHMSNHNTSGIVTPYEFDGSHDYANYVQSYAKLNQPPGHSVMFSFPHFHVKPIPGCRFSFLQFHLQGFVLGGWLHVYWRHCGNLQLPPKLHAYNPELYLAFYTRGERGYSGFKVQFSFHSKTELPEKLFTNTVNTSIFNCSVPIYATFSQHLVCNLETECVNAEDEASCPYWQGDCQSDFLSAGGRCYKYVKTRKRMTWYDASSVCLKQGLTLASFPTFKQGKAFRDGILRYAPTTFNVFIGLRTSESSLAAIYREMWQWSSGIMAYYVHIGKQQLFKPTCASFGAMNREKLSTTLCGFYEYMHYIFCEMETSSTFNQSNRIHLSPTQLKSTFSGVNNSRFVTCLEGHLMHDFLSCDYESQCAADPGVKSCVSYIKNPNYARNMEVLMYVCDSQTQTIHYSQVCDHQAQCFDSSDESFCIYRQCSEKQCQNQQCVTVAQWCDGMAHCSDGSDEVCPQFMTVSTRPSSDSIEGFHVVLFDGYGRYSYVPQGEHFPFCPPTHFVCLNHELCLPVYLRCNGVYDCADREDEDNCDSVTCPGFYRCRQSTVCVHSDHVCDGVFQCPQQDDELLCQLVCPDTCLCQGFAFLCSRSFPAQAYSDLRYLDASDSGLPPDKLSHNLYLIRLLLLRCDLYTLPVFGLPNLKFLHLDDNMLTNVKMEVFSKLSNLNILSLSRNPIAMLVAFESNVLLENLHSLDLSHTKLRYFESKTLWIIRNLKMLNMSHGILNTISSSGFRSLKLLESLDLRGSKLKEYPVKMLQSLAFLQIVYSDVYKLCCQDILPKQFNTQNCYTSPDEIASCKDLLRSDIYRMFLWITCCFAVVGNIGSFATRIYAQKGKQLTSFNIFISHLNAADFFMGLYLAMVGTADQVYRGTYLWHDEKWKSSAGCTTAGFFSLLSCEMSAFIICFITLDRVLVINFPFGQVRFRNKSAQLVCTLSWMVGLTLATLPLLPVTSHWEFYSHTDICIPLPVTKQDFKGHFYSFGILIILNFLLFIVIAFGQMVIYISVRVNALRTEQKNEREITMARRLLTVVLSDFLCWFPIGLFGLLASSGVSIPGEINVAIAIFAMPLNSALNPFLYTFNLIMEKRRKASEERLLRVLQSRCAGKVLIRDN